MRCTKHRYVARKAVISSLITAMILMGVVAAKAATPNLCDSIDSRISLELRPAYNIVKHYAFRDTESGKPLNSSLSLHARYAFSLNPNSKIGELYPKTYQGIGLAAYTFWNHRQIGTPIALYIFQGAHIADIGKSLSIGYEWNFGASFGWQRSDAIASPCNIYISVAIPLSWHVTPHWELSLTPDFTHFSDGDTLFPNSGVDMFGLRLGATYHFGSTVSHKSARGYLAASERLSTLSTAQRMTYDIILYGGWRADRFFEDGSFYIINKPLPLGGLHFQPLYHLNDHFSLGAALDIQIDSSLNLYGATKNEQGEVTDYLRPSLWQQTEVGISLHGEIRAPIFAVGAGFGINLFKHGYDMSRFYTLFTLKTFLTQRLFLYIGYRYNSTQYTHNMMYGLGLRF